MLSTLRPGRGVCSWASVRKLSKFQPQLVRTHANLVRVSLTGQAGRRSGQQIFKRYSANEAKTTVRGIPVESTRAGLTGTHIIFYFAVCVLYLEMLLYY